MLQFITRKFSSSKLIDIVSRLRNETALSMNLCRKAAIESNFDYYKAFDLLSKSANGVIQPISNEVFNFGKDGLVGIFGTSIRKCLLQLRCDSDFVAQNPEFINLADSIMSTALVDDTLSTQSSKKHIQDMVSTYCSKFRENIGVESIKIFEIDINHKMQAMGQYIHQKIGSNTGKIGSIVRIEAETSVNSSELEDIGHSLARQVVALNNSKIDASSLINSEYLFSRVGTVRNFIESFEEKLNSKLSVKDIACVKIK